MFDIIIFVGFWHMFLYTATTPPPAKRVVNVYKTCSKRVKACSKRVLSKRRPFLPHETKRGIRD